MGNERRSARQLYFFSGRRRTEPKAKASVSPRAKAEVKAERNCEYCSGGREPLARSARQLCFFSGRREGVEAAGDRSKAGGGNEREWRRRGSKQGGMRKREGGEAKGIEVRGEGKREEWKGEGD